MAENWSDEELKAAVDMYLAMAKYEADRKPYNKRQIYRELAGRFARTDKAFEFRMQNISAILKEQGKPWVPGLWPAENIGANVKPRIVALLENGAKTGRLASRSIPSYKAKLPAMRDWLREVARVGESVTYEQVMEVFGIDRFSLKYALEYLGRQAENLDEPIITAIVVSKKTKRCSSGFAKEFGNRDDVVERELLRKYWKVKENETIAGAPAATKEDIEVKAARFVSVEARPDQAAFRRRVFLACNGRCMVSGCDVDKALDAAHKHDRDWRAGHNNAEDGILLRKDLHALYDSKLLWLNSEGTIELHPSVLAHYKEFRGKFFGAKD
ncbi:MAG TPA: HNH endonuclease signature motif containing protein [bacterium]|nr:HNH endonuclease signature motif containing protein [bacterium]